MSSLHLQRSGKYSQPQYFLVGGFVAGLLLFLAWLAWLPDTARHRAGGQSASSAVGVLGPASPEQGVLDGITGVGSAAGQSGMAINGPQTLESDAEIGADEANGEAADVGQDSDGFQGGNPEPAIEDGQAITNGILDQSAVPPPAQATVPNGSLQTYFVEVMTEPGVFEILQVNAESPEHARTIVHEAGGDARITRGPSLEPLD